MSNWVHSKRLLTYPSFPLFPGFQIDYPIHPSIQSSSFELAPYPSVGRDLARSLSVSAGTPVGGIKWTFVALEAQSLAQCWIWKLYPLLEWVHLPTRALDRWFPWFIHNNTDSYQSIYPSIYLSIDIPIDTPSIPHRHRSVYRSIHRSIHPSTPRSTHPSTHRRRRRIYLSTLPPIDPPTGLPIHPPP